MRVEEMVEIAPDSSQRFFRSFESWRNNKEFPFDGWIYIFKLKEAHRTFQQDRSFRIQFINDTWPARTRKTSQA